MIRDVLLVDGIDLNLQVKDKKDLFEKMSTILYEHGKINSKSDFIVALNNREKEGMTGMGDGLAIPHGLSSCVAEPTVLFCRLAHEVEYESMDGKGVNKVFMIAVPANSGQEHLKIIAQLARKMMHKEFVIKLDEIKTSEELLELI